LPVLAPAARARLEAAVPDGVSERASRRLALAHDASHYLLTPAAVITPRDARQVGALLRASGELGLPLTFRSGGTSLSGQGVTDGLLVDVRRHFRGLEILDEGARVRVQPGVTIGQVNARLARYGRKLGPDPASEAVCTVGGVVANNSSGMVCGTELTAYRTLASCTFVLPSGTVVETGRPDAGARLRETEPDLHEGLLRLRERVRGNPGSVETIRRQFAIKNTMGYALNAFLDHDDPVYILAHLLVGSEGTLAFLAEATFDTVPVSKDLVTGLFLYPNLAAAVGTLPDLVAAGFAAIELLDATSLRVGQADPGAVATLRDLAVDQHAALLVEFQEHSPEALAARVAAAGPLLRELPTIAPAQLSADAAARASLWSVRKGLYAAVAGARPPGATALLEDVAVPVPHLLEATEHLAELFVRHRYEAPVVFGHAKDGNLHFLLNERFDEPGHLDRYEAFTADPVDLILGSGGTLKAEHGTGASWRRSSAGSTAMSCTT